MVATSSSPPIFAPNSKWRKQIVPHRKQEQLDLLDAETGHPKPPIEMGIDVFLLEANLALTPAERLGQLDDMLALSDAVQGAANDA